MDRIGQCETAGVLSQLYDMSSTVADFVRDARSVCGVFPHFNELTDVFAERAREAIGETVAHGLRAAMPEGAEFSTTSPSDYVVRFADDPDVATFLKVYDSMASLPNLGVRILHGKPWVRAEIDGDDFTLQSSAYVDEDADETIRFPACGWTARTSVAAWRRNGAFPSFVLGVRSVGVVVEGDKSKLVGWRPFSLV